MRIRFIQLSGLLLGVMLLAACGARTPFTGSMARIDADAVNNGEKSLVVMRVSTTWGSPAETRWLHKETGELVTVTSKFTAKTQEVASGYDMVTLPAGTYVLSYVRYSDGTGGGWSTGPFDIDPGLSKVSALGQVRTAQSGSGPVVTTSELRSTGLGKNGKTPLIASFTLTPGKALYLGDMTIAFTIEGKQQLPGYYPADTVAYSIKQNLERARLALSKEDGGMALKLQNGQIARGSLARNLGSPRAAKPRNTAAPARKTGTESNTNAGMPEMKTGMGDDTNAGMPEMKAGAGDDAAR